MDDFFAGHVAMLLCRKTAGRRASRLSGMPVEVRHRREPLEEGSRHASPGGDTLLLFSDGLVELRYGAGEEFGDSGLQGVLRRGGLPAVTRQ